MSFVDKFFIFISFIVLCILIGFIFYWKLTKRTFTRERFAFVGLASIIMLISIVLPIIAGNTNGWIEAYNIISTRIGTEKFPVAPPSLVEKMFCVTLVLIHASFIQSLFKNWNGELSVRQFELNKLKEKASLISDTRALLKKDPNVRRFDPEIDEKNEVRACWEIL